MMGGLLILDRRNRMADESFYMKSQCLRNNCKYYGRVNKFYTSTVTARKGKIKSQSFTVPMIRNSKRGNRIYRTTWNFPVSMIFPALSRSE
jgi:hypothetical protein